MCVAELEEEDELPGWMNGLLNRVFDQTYTLSAFISACGMCDTDEVTMAVPTRPDFLGILYVATAGQNGPNLGADEEEVVVLSLSIVQRDLKKVLGSTSLLVQPRGKSSADINENEHASSSDLLSEECKAELGITENELRDKGKPLIDVISELDILIRRHVAVEEEVIEDETKEQSVRSSMSFAFITEGQLPLRQTILPEACTKDILLPDYYYSFFDLKKEFCACYNQTCESVADMVKFLELKVKLDDGEEPRVTTEQTEALDDQANDDEECNTEEEKKSGSESNYKAKLPEMSAVVMRLLEDVNTFQKPESIMVKLEPGICSKNESVDGNCVVRARGLPWQSSDQDIARFFRGLNIAKGGVALCLSPQGRRNGEALIRFESLEHRDMALKRHKHHIANRYIEVYKASGEDFLSVAGGNNNEAQAFLSKGGQVIIRMRGLPYDCTPKQVVEFFDSGDNACKVLDGEEGVLFVKRPDGRATGDAFVQFQHEDDASNALAKHRESIGARYIELFRSTTAEVQQVLNRCIITAAAAAAAAAASSSSSNNSEPLLKTLPPHALHSELLNSGAPQLPLLPNVIPAPVVQPPSNSQLNGPSHILPQHIITSGTRKDCIRLRGLPYEAQVEHILEFLGEHAKNIVYQGVHMVYNAQGQPSGEAFIQMDSEQSAYLAAQSKHHRYMHHFKKQRYIEVFQCSGDDMNLVLTGGIPKQHSNASVSQATAQLLHGHPAGTPLLGTPGQSGLTSSSTSPSSSSSCNGSSLVASIPNTLVSHHHAAAAAAHQYYTPHPNATVLSAIPRTSNSYYAPVTFYWPYPSPPVSPTYYPANGVINHTHHLGIPVPQSHQALVPSTVPHGGGLHTHDGKHYASVNSQSGDSHIRVIDSRSGQMHGAQEYIIDPHHGHVNVQHVSRPPPNSYVTEKPSSQYRHHHHHHGHAHHGGNVIPNHTKPLPGNVPPHHYMMELGLFMA